MARGRVSLAPGLAPLVEINFMEDGHDLARMVIGFRRVAEIFASEPVRSVAASPFTVRFTDRIRRLNSLSRLNAVKAGAISAAFDVVPGLANQVLPRLSGPRVDIQALAADRERLEEHIRENVARMFHAVGTCRMGSPGDRDAVVDPARRVRHVGGLRVIDASIMPTVPRGNTNIPTIMLAGKLAAEMNAEAR